ncbi:uncharacterized protein SOCEGT47_081190 [Sorangium cellulosum]|uniref:Uncharacterized protein n=1 Tax=Sorangium cellulosum TaxID=56 RepID=A0A4P2QCP5_SORCE|nr:uncharacterized protein SOCEGT47_081190 [Sorangium cellulosum]
MRPWPEAPVGERASLAVAGARRPGVVDWLANAPQTEQVPPGAHRSFHSVQRFTRDVTRERRCSDG